jgi:hypothetical protein
MIKQYFSYLKSIWSQESIGFGDTVAKITKSFGIEPCEACLRRKKKFNEAIQYRKKLREKEQNGQNS